jgi:hypothetical protein
MVQPWRYFFHFPASVASLLTDLTTLNGYLPRGAPTSSYLANLIFWDVEAELTSSPEKKGIIYSRYIDDVTLSAKRDLNQNDKANAVAQVYQMFYKKRVLPNRKKEKVMYSHAPIQVHGINVNSKEPTIPKPIRKNIEAGVYNLSRDIMHYEFTNEIIGRWKSLSGSIAWMKMFHPEQSERLKKQLTTAVVSYVSRTNN